MNLNDLDYPAYLVITDYDQHPLVSCHDIYKSRKLRCILTTIFEIFICCTLYKLFIIRIRRKFK